MEKFYLEKKNELSYGKFTEISKSLNWVLGDTTGRSVSRRTAHGLKNAFNSPELDDDIAELITHQGMVLTAGLLFSKNVNSQVVGVLLLLVLVLFYQNGKQQPVSQTFDASQWSNIKWK